MITSRTQKKACAIVYSGDKDIEAELDEIASIIQREAERDKPKPSGYWQGWTTSAFIGIDEYNEPKWADRKFYRCSICHFGSAVKFKHCPKCGITLDDHEPLEVQKC